jgi:hypothetical protein
MSSVYTATCTVAATYQGISLEGGGMVSAVPSKLLVVRFNTNILSVAGMFDLQEEEYWATNATLSGILLDEFGDEITTVALLYASGATASGSFIGNFGGTQFSPDLGRGYTLVLQGVSDWGNAFNLPILAEVVNSPFPPGYSGSGS